MARYTLVIDTDLCSGCRGCEVACKNENGIALGETWNKVVQVGPIGTFPDVYQYYLPVQCQQCEDAPCVDVCPTAASYRNDDDIVLVDKEKCIGCKYCMMACPYGVRSWNEQERVVEKCTLCLQRTTDGQLPSCVHNCSNGARFYGDLDDPDSDASKALQNKPNYRLADVGNLPTTVYLLSEKNGSWIESENLESENPEWANSSWKEV